MEFLLFFKDLIQSSFAFVLFHEIAGLVVAAPPDWPQPPVEGGVLPFQEHRLLAHLMLYVSVLKEHESKECFHTRVKRMNAYFNITLILIFVSVISFVGSSIE